MIIVLLVTFAVFIFFEFEMGYQLYIKLRKDPPGVVCDMIYENYSEKKMQFMAAIEYVYLYIEKEENGRFGDLEYRISQTGDLPCFCT